MLKWVPISSSRISSWPWESNLSFLQRKWILYYLSHQGSPTYLLSLIYGRLTQTDELGQAPALGFACAHVCVCVCVCVYFCVFCQHWVHMSLVESVFSSFTTLGTMIYCQTLGYLAHLHNLSGFWRHLTLYLLIKSIPTPKSVINRHLLNPPGVSTPSLITPVSIWVEPRKNL